MSEKMQLKAAELEMKAMSDMFSMMNRSCFEKCVNKKFEDQNLRVSEQSCIDRCVLKYMEVHKMVGEMLQQNNKQQQ